MKRYGVALVIASALGFTLPAAASTLCATHGGSVKLRDTCRPRETAIDATSLGLQGPPGLNAWERPCPPDSVRVAGTCVDKYEASIWSIPAGNTALLDKVQKGEVTLADLTGGGAVQYAPASFFICFDPLLPATFPISGNWTDPFYAVSVPGVHPTGCLSWLQAEQACALSGKRLLTNQEWQRAAAGTPDPGVDDGLTSCVITGGPENTGSRSACVSNWGVHDMVGNLYEWVADWGEHATGCTLWSDEFGTDESCVGGDGVYHLPGVLARGGYWGLTGGVYAGVFAAYQVNFPYTAVEGIGFRCGR
jgi:hypothetical protein